MAWPGPHTEALWSQGLDELAKAFVAGGWYTNNLRMARAVALRHTKLVLRESDLFSPEELDTLPFNADFINRLGFRWVIGTFIGESRGRLTAFVAERKANAAPLSARKTSRS